MRVSGKPFVNASIYCQIFCSEVFFNLSSILFLKGTYTKSQNPVATSSV